MLFSRYFIPTLKDSISEEESRNFQLLAKGGFVRKSKSGYYVILPLGKRYLDKLYDYINLPILEKSGVETGRVEPEAMLDAVLGDLESYKVLPQILYSRYTKNFDRRPRYGVVESTRSEMMGGVIIGGHRFADACVGLDDAILQRLLFSGLRAGMASRNSICLPGIADQVFFCKNESGSYNYLECSKCGAAYDFETAMPEEHAAVDRTLAVSTGVLRMVETPGVRTIAELEKFFTTLASDFMKTFIFIADGKPLAAVVRGDRNISLQKLMCTMGISDIRKADDKEVEEITGAAVGFAGPVGLEIRIVADNEVINTGSFIAGANLTGYHLANVTAGRDFQAMITGDIRCISAGEPCRCGGILQESKGFQIGSVEYIGPKWFEGNGYFYTSEKGEKVPYEGAKYNVDLLAVAGLLVEACDNGKFPQLPQDLAPFDVVIIVANVKDEVQLDLAIKLNGELKKRKVQPLVDDRDERIGVKFNDAEVMGIPIKIVCGKRSAEGIVEVMESASGNIEMPYENAIDMLSIYEDTGNMFD